jgi:hypothetical protein
MRGDIGELPNHYRLDGYPNPFVVAQTWHYHEFQFLVLVVFEYEETNCCQLGGHLPADQTASSRLCQTFLSLFQPDV